MNIPSPHRPEHFASMRNCVQFLDKLVSKKLKSFKIILTHRVDNEYFVHIQIIYNTNFCTIKIIKIQRPLSLNKDIQLLELEHL